MSRLTRALVLGAMLGALNLAGMTAVAHAQANVARENQTTTDPAAQRAQARQRYWYYESMRTSRQQTAADAAQQQNPTDAVELFRRGERASQEQTAADAALRRQLARERFSIPSGTPAQAPAPEPAEPSGQPGWLVASLGVLIAALALVAGVAVMAARRASRKVRAGQAA